MAVARECGRPLGVWSDGTAGDGGQRTECGQCGVQYHTCLLRTGDTAVFVGVVIDGGGGGVCCVCVCVDTFLLPHGKVGLPYLGGGFFHACEDLGRKFNHLFPTCTFFLKWRLAHAH